MPSDIPSVTKTSAAKRSATNISMPTSIPVLLSVLAGYVDSCTFLALFGLFVAQVTGSFVLAGTQLVAHEEGGLIKLLAIPAFFSACVATTLMVAAMARRGRSALAAALSAEAALLAGLFASWLAGAPFRGPDGAAAILASLFGLSAMGVQSALVRLTAEGAPSTNVMTTNTTQLAIDATKLLIAWRARRKSPRDEMLAAAHRHAKERFDGVWPVVLGFLAGTVTGALAYARFDLWCILAGIGLALSLAWWAHGRERALASA